MIHTLSFSKAVALHHHITDHNPKAFVVANSNTPVATLVDPLIAPALFYNDASEDHQSVASIAALLERNSVVKEGTDTYEMTLRNFVQLTAESIRRTVYLTRTVALPLIEELTVATEERLNTVTGGNGLALSILIETQSDILQNPTLINAIEPFNQVSNSNTETLNVHSPRESAELLELIRVGYDDFDNELAAWIGAHLSADVVGRVYSRVFCSTGKTSYMSSVFDSSADSYPEALIAFLLARGLNLNTDDNINLTAAEYDYRMSLITNYCAMVVKRAIARNISADKNDRVVMRYPPQGQELSYDRPDQGIIVVNKNVYTKFLNEGGSPEAIMGSYLVDRQSDSTKLLMERTQYVNHYNTRLLKVRSDQRLKTISLMRKHIEESIAHQIALIGSDSEEAGIWKGIMLDQATAQRLLRVAVDGLNLDKMDDVYSTIRDIVLDVFFSETDVAKIIGLIDAVSLDHPGDIKGAANVAIIDYIVDWFMHQTQLCTK